MKFITKVLFFVLFAFCQSVFAENWQICVGSFHNKQNAENREKILNENGISVHITEFKKSDNETLYRVIYEEILSDKQSAQLHKEMLAEVPVIKNLKIDDLWLLGNSSEEVSVEEGRFLLITDSDNGNPVPDADVNIDQKWDVKSSSEGKAPLPREVEDGEHSVTVTKEGEYVATSGNFTLENGKVASAPQISIPKAVDYERIKIVLDWGEYPADLDSHIFSKNYHVYYPNQIDGNLSLDHDDTTSYGPETVTIRDIDKNDVYRYFVHNYSDKFDYSSERLSNSNARVQVYFNNELKQTFNIKQGLAGTIWHVFDIVDGDKIDVKDVVTNDFE